MSVATLIGISLQGALVEGIILQSISVATLVGITLQGALVEGIILQSIVDTTPINRVALQGICVATLVDSCVTFGCIA
ncbi:hypothetical protein N7468_009169 [Penicillium chermesinum]|uniref:Uncharacterized protein n=1 Tax=Penicillium chermesinum TaxID=63820 RepID=A0A9W9TFW5_9EURO|nr:uncharacterized protein N7468_009169 [Penicillium chermesinum]KAJ5219965.1 hypothetical protein N7468_009169 [Penicillium chermesinum]KAJ6157424.1 hypothetical protein N7470_005016 [Penicillium chermesinum]